LHTFGILVLNKMQEQQYYHEIALRAKKLSFHIYLFEPSDIDPSTEHVHGLKFSDSQQNWVKEKYPIPRFIYDRCFYSSRLQFKQNHPIVQWLKNKQETTFIGYGLPNKWELYKVFKQDDPISPYIPSTFKIKTSSDIFSKLESWGAVLFKPESGAQGKGIFVLQKEHDHILLRFQRQGNHAKKIFKTEEECFTWISNLLNKASYLIQPFLPLHDENLCPFDVRIFLQKDAEGHWIEKGRAIRYGQSGNIISNLHAGAQTTSYSNWLKKYSKRERDFLNEEINMLIKEIPIILEKNFSPLFELGLDIGIAKDLSLWLLDANSKPGRQILLQENLIEEDILYEAPLRYCQYLINREAIEKEIKL
jgi:hypothetical protein